MFPFFHVCFPFSLFSFKKSRFFHFVFFLFFIFSKYVLYIDICLFHLFTFLCLILLYFVLFLLFFTSLLLYFFTSSICAEMIAEMRGADLMGFEFIKTVMTVIQCDFDFFE